MTVRVKVSEKSAQKWYITVNWWLGIVAIWYSIVAWGRVGAFGVDFGGRPE